MEEKTSLRLDLNCSFCVNHPTCTHMSNGLCNLFAPSEAAFSICVNKHLTETTTTGLSFRQAEKEALKGRCIRRKAWGKEAFVWRREMKTLSPDTNDPYVREACRRAGSHTLAEGACFAKLDYDSRCKGLPRVILHWMPADENDLNATDWEVFDVPATYGDENKKEDKKDEFAGLKDILEKLFGSNGKTSVKVCSCDGDVRDLFDVVTGRVKRSIMSDLDDLLK